jgi:hypothetical protein
MLRAVAISLQQWVSAFKSRILKRATIAGFLGISQFNCSIYMLQGLRMIYYLRELNETT